MMTSSENLIGNFSENPQNSYPLNKSPLNVDSISNSTSDNT